ncbi:MAG: glycosyltransferase [Bacteroidota bacterium]|nr:glycosyltransferase [Bacteroidota bacterium]
MNWLLIVLLPYMIIFLIFWISLQQEGKKAREGDKKLKSQKKVLSVVIPLKNEESNIQNLIHDLAAQSLDQDHFEVIFVDDASSDSTLEIIQASGKLLNVYKILLSPGHGKKKAIAHGINYAKSEFIVSTDGDCRVEKEWLQEIYNFIISYHADMIIGAVDIINTGSFINRFIQLEFLGLQAVTEVFAKAGKPVICNGANLCFRNPGSEKYIEMVNETVTSGDDIFLMESYRKDGKIISWIDSPSSMVMTQGPGSMKTFIKQRIRWTSKSPFYTQPSLILLALLVFLTNLLISAAFIASFFIPGMWIIFISLFIMKSIPDLLILAVMARKRNKPGLLQLFIPAQLIYPLYVVTTGMAGVVTGLFSSRQGK